MSAEERTQLIPANRRTTPGSSILPGEATTGQSVGEENALATKLGELHALTAQLAREYSRIETSSRNAEHRANAIADRLAALTAAAEKVSLQSAATLRRLEQLSPGARRVDRPWSVIGVLGVVALVVSFIVTRPGEDAAQAGSNSEIVQATLHSDVVLPETTSTSVAPTTGSAPAATLPVPDAQPQPQARRLPAPGFVGTLTVQSEPAGADVFVDRTRVGTTPIQLGRLRAGSHLIWIERAGYQRWTASVLVPAEKLTRVNATLALESDR